MHWLKICYFYISLKRLVSCAWIVCPWACSLALQKSGEATPSIHTSFSQPVTMSAKSRSRCPRNAGHDDWEITGHDDCEITGHDGAKYARTHVGVVMLKDEQIYNATH